ncbi:PREDICTED: protein FAR1-RELATED SEQUENCE 5-like [Ipomoea nil]|uniref:protein FAR1-RELATED SEQUENCE 5-like n=1 Tax=Ipomoea nil TaxID=35883 RepID=UPI0009019782|nr:PREDICTED: protein FAR1-RELATED SEQUENCE 5-like [Ipomoea nil]
MWISSENFRHIKSYARSIMMMVLLDYIKVNGAELQGDKNLEECIIWYEEGILLGNNITEAFNYYVIGQCFPDIDDVIEQQEIAVTDEGNDLVHLAVIEDDAPVDQNLVGMSVCSIDETYDMYNEYAFRLGFSVRKGKQRYSGAMKTVKTKTFHFSKAGFKRNLGKGCYAKVDGRTCCPALVQFDVDGNGMWTASKHEKLHNHDLVPPSKSYHLQSHRMVSRNHLSYLKDLKKSGVFVADGIRFIKTQSSGSPRVGFTSRDAYNPLCTDALKKLDGTDSNTLIEIFR